MSKVSLFGALALVLASVSLSSGPASASQGFNLDFLDHLPRPAPASPPASQGFNFDFLNHLPRPAPRRSEGFNLDFLDHLFPKH